jgi:DNA replication protein DnaC
VQPTDEARERSCPDCGGTGWIASVTEPGRVTRCACRRRRDADRLLQNAHIPARYCDCTLGAYAVHREPEGCGRATTGQRGFFRVNDDPQLLRAAVACKRYIEEFLSDSAELRFRDGGLLFSGPPGVGKTHLAAAVLRELILNYHCRGRFVDVTSFTQDLQSAIDPDAPFSRNELLEPIESAEVLVVDELGAQSLRPWAADVLYDLVNRRYARRLPTIFTTNYRLDDPSGSTADSLTADRAVAGFEGGGQRDAARARELPGVQGAGVLSRRIPGMLVSRLWEMTQVISLDAVRDYRMEVRAHQHRA